MPREMQEPRKVIVYIAASIDGFIAGSNDDMSFLSVVHKEGEDYGYSGFINSVDTVIMGRRTYDWVMAQVPEFPHSDKITYIITHTPLPSAGMINFYTGSLKELVMRLKGEAGRNIFIDGGSQVVNELLNLKLIDELIISYIPVLLGGGTPLFRDGKPLQRLKFIEVKQFDTGLVQLHYRCEKE
jgi:dihydrofolate reductase